MKAVLAVALGGAVGAVARYGVAGWVQEAAGSTFPWGTVAVNVTGSFVLGFLLVWFEATTAAPEVRAFLAVGIMGSFTTFSTFTYETVALLRDGDVSRAAAYALGSLALGVVAAVLGMLAAGRVPS